MQNPIGNCDQFIHNQRRSAIYPAFDANYGCLLQDERVSF